MDLWWYDPLPTSAQSAPSNRFSNNWPAGAGAGAALFTSHQRQYHPANPVPKEKFDDVDVGWTIAMESRAHLPRNCGIWKDETERYRGLCWGEICSDLRIIFSECGGGAPGVLADEGSPRRLLEEWSSGYL